MQICRGTLSPFSSKSLVPTQTSSTSLESTFPHLGLAIGGSGKAAGLKSLQSGFLQALFLGHHLLVAGLLKASGSLQLWA